MLDARFGISSGDLVGLEDVVVSKVPKAGQPRLANGVDDLPKGHSRQPPKLTLTQITQRQLEPTGSESLVDDAHRFEEDENEESEPSPARFAASQAKYAESLRSKFGPDWISEHPLINPMKIIEEAADRPMSAAFMCKQACVLLNVGNHARVRRYLVAGYCVAQGFKAHREQIKDLAFDLQDGRSTNPMKKETVEQNLMHYVFIYIFYQSGMETRDRAAQYAQSLKYYFDRDTAPIEVDKLLKQYGQNKLRLAAQLRDNILKGAREWVQQGKDPTSVTMEEVLASMSAGEAKLKKAHAATDQADYSPRDIAPGIVKHKAEVDNLSDEAEWLLENDPDKNPDVAEFDEDDELEPDDPLGEENTQLPEVDEFFSDMMRLTAQLVVGLDNRLDPLHREPMLFLIRELWIKVVRFRKLLA
ncbi:hypothetical protein MKK70_27250 [Methylobacterium sp. E-041]|uniref:hypothetical protein n=1 Tax=Methylobacterium sp. E-041 TaxID=2836573 RepID=UPI001FB9DFFE|nr:hypothetical protein [Methylobacterium sp. E-041]MCJ2108998.1 hypothetical protein [Methylobacterium sp. E-041]